MKIQTKEQLDKYLQGNIKKLSKKNITIDKVNQILEEQNNIIIKYLENVNKTFIQK